MDKAKNRPTVLIVDMDASFRAQCAQALKKQNIEVVGETGNSHDAYILALRTKPSVITSDIYATIPNKKKLCMPDSIAGSLMA